MNETIVYINIGNVITAAADVSTINKITAIGIDFAIKRSSLPSPSPPLNVSSKAPDVAGKSDERGRFVDATPDLSLIHI